MPQNTAFGGPPSCALMAIAICLLTALRLFHVTLGVGPWFALISVAFSGALTTVTRVLILKHFGTDLESNLLPLQVMASGLSHSTAPENNSPEDCTGVEYRHDQAGLRVAGSCGMYTGPNFGMVEVRIRPTALIPEAQSHCFNAMLDISFCPAGSFICFAASCVCSF